jgi:integrase
MLRTDKNRTACQIVLLLLSLGCRLNELLSAKWVDVDLERKILKIRATNSKSRQLRSVPLNESAMEVLNVLDTQGKFEYLFINRQTGNPYTTITKVWGRLRKQSGLDHLRLHDLRHQYASFLVNSGRTLYEVQQIPGHSDSKVTQRYAHLSTKTLCRKQPIAHQPKSRLCNQRRDPGRTPESEWGAPRSVRAVPSWFRGGAGAQASPSRTQSWPLRDRFA